MRISKALLVLFLALFSFAPRAHAQAAAIFITANGAPTGACQTGVQTPAFFNNSANWGTGSSQIGHDTVVTICGTFNGSAGQNGYFQFQASGTSGHPITLRFDTGAVLQAPYFGNGSGAIDFNGRSFVTIDGGTNGTIQNTANGSSLANKKASNFVFSFGGSNPTVMNLNMLNVYVHVINDVNGNDARGISVRGVTNLTVKGNTFSWCDQCLYMAFDGGENNLVVSGNTFSHRNQAIEFGPSNAGTRTLTNVQIDHNTDNASNEWDTPQNACGSTSCFHHNFFHPFTNTAGSSIVGTLQIFDNTLHGALGVSTSYIYLENNNGGSGGTMGCWWIYNNTFDKTDFSTGSTGVFVGYPGEGCGVFANNTIRDAGTGGNSSANSWPAIHIYDAGWIVKNNIVQTNGYAVYYQGGNSALGADHNIYYTFPASGGTGDPWIWQGSPFLTSLSAWQGKCGCDANSLTTDPKLNPDMTLGAGSSAVGAGIPLTSLGIPGLAFDKNGNPRTGSVWDAGATNSNSGTTQGSVTLSPTSLLFGNQNINTTSAQQLITITNGTPSNVTLGTPAVSLTGTEFAKNSSSTDALVLASGDSCAVGVTFTPTATGARASTLTVNYGASSTVTAPLTGTGINPTAISLINYTNCTSQSFSGSCAIPATQSGDSLIVGFSTNNGYLAQTVTSVTDNAPGGTDTCSQVSGARSTNINSPDFTDIWFCPNVKAGASLLNINTSATVAGESQIWEVSNINAVDTACALNVQPSNASPTSCPITTTQAADFIASVADYQGSISGGFSGNAFTNDSIMQGNGISHLITSAVGTYTAKWSSGSAGAYNNSTAAFYKSTGNMAPVVAFNPLVANFPNGVLGVTSSPVDVTLTNTGNATLTISGKTITGANVGDFAAAPTDTCGSSLAAGSSCVFHFEFTPSVLGTRTATFSFNDNAFGSPHSITLTGTNSSAPIIPIVAPPQNVVAVPN